MKDGEGLMGSPSICSLTIANMIVTACIVPEKDMRTEERKGGWEDGMKASKESVRR